jgi:hypothetical protein
MGAFWDDKKVLLHVDHAIFLSLLTSNNSGEGFNCWGKAKANIQSQLNTTATDAMGQK